MPLRNKKSGFASSNDRSQLSEAAAKGIGWNSIPSQKNDLANISFVIYELSNNTSNRPNSFLPD